MTGKEIIDLRNTLKAARMPLEAHWDELAELFMPYRSIDANGMPDLLSAEECFDTTARQCALILANGLNSLVTPREEAWFEYQPPRELRNDDVAVKFYRQATELARELLESSNFYEEIQECYMESPVMGTTALFIGDKDLAGLYFLNQPIKTYYIKEDFRNRVNCIIRELVYTADQAAAEFGKKNLPKEIADKVGKPTAAAELFDFLHIVYPNENPDNSKKEKPFVSKIVYEKTKAIVSTGGFDEFPFAVQRWRRHRRCVWGFGPGSYAKGEPRQLNFLNQIIDTATEKAVFPPVIAPSNLEGEIGLGALEITYVDTTDPNSPQVLREWATAGRIDIAQARMMDKRQQLESAFFVDLFKLFAARQGAQPLSATEANYAAAEKLSQFSPVFGRFVSEMLDPILTRIFGMLVRSGELGEIPANVLKQIGPNRSGIAMPGVLYKNRILLAIQSKNNRSLSEYMMMAEPILQFFPDAGDEFDFRKITRDTARNSGLPEDWLRSQKDSDAIKAAREAQRQQQEQLIAAQQTADIAQKVGNTPPDTRAQLGL